MTELEEIYQRYFKDVYLFVYSLSKNQHVAEDITSETFLKAMRTLDSFKGESDIKVWLFQIAKNTYYSYLRKNKRVVPILVSCGLLLGACGAANHPNRRYNRHKGCAKRQRHDGK